MTNISINGYSIAPLIDAHGVADTTWSESGITWNNRPAVDPAVQDEADVPVNGSVWPVTFDVTKWVQAHTGGLISFNLAPRKACLSYLRAQH